MNRVFTKMLLGALVTLATASVASAQTATPKAELSAGYQFQKFSEDGPNIGKGWYADIAGGVAKNVSLVGQVTGGYKSESLSFGSSTTSVSMNVHSFMGGVRFNSPEGKSSFFVQLLAGAVRIGAGTSVPGTSASVSDSDTAKAILGGIGFTGQVAKNLSVRIGGDYVRVFPDGDSGFILRAQAGLVYAFGGR